MNINNFVSFILVIILLSYVFKNIFIKEEDKDISIMLILGGLGIFSSDMELIVFYINPNANIPKETDNILYVIALILIVLGILMNYFEKKQHHVFNLLGENNKKELIDNNFKVKNINNGVIHERSIDFMILIDSEKINNDTNEIVNKLITKEAKTINHYPFRENVYLTSMASIPYTVLFGAFLEDKSIINYLNYNRLNSEFELLPNKVRKRKNLKISIKENICKQESNNLKEILISISGTFQIHNSDIEDFKLSNRADISTNNTKENNISSQQEIKDISNEIVDYLINISKYFDVIHIVAAIPGMLALEIGKTIKNRNNQIKQIIFYHYNAQSVPRYKYGIIVNGENKGKLIERRV